jgi:hypothetical protein
MKYSGIENSEQHGPHAAAVVRIQFGQQTALQAHVHANTTGLQTASQACACVNTNGLQTAMQVHACVDATGQQTAS